MKKYFFTLIACIICWSGVDAQLTADQIVDKAIEKAGGKVNQH